MSEAESFPFGQGVPVVGTVQDDLTGFSGVSDVRKDFPGGQVVCDDERVARMIDGVFAGQYGYGVFCMDEQTGLAEQLLV